MICDELRIAGLTCRLVRSTWHESSRRALPHAWNEVGILDALFICDALFAPGKLLPIDSAAAKKYRRIEAPASPGSSMEPTYELVTQAELFDQAGTVLDFKREDSLGRGGYGEVRNANAHTHARTCTHAHTSSTTTNSNTTHRHLIDH